MAFKNTRSQKHLPSQTVDLDEQASPQSVPSSPIKSKEQVSSNTPKPVPQKEVPPQSTILTPSNPTNFNPTNFNPTTPVPTNSTIPSSSTSLTKEKEQVPTGFLFGSSLGFTSSAPNSDMILKELKEIKGMLTTSLKRQEGVIQSLVDQVNALQEEVPIAMKKCEDAVVAKIEEVVFESISEA